MAAINIFYSATCTNKVISHTYQCSIIHLHVPTHFTKLSDPSVQYIVNTIKQTIINSNLHVIAIIQITLYQHLQVYAH